MTSTISPKYRSMCPVSDTYNDVAPLIISVVMSFRRKYGHTYASNLEDMMSDAKVAFMEAYRSYDSKKGEFQKRVSFSVWHRLKDKARDIAKNKNVQYILMSDVPTDSDKDMYAFLEGKQEKFCLSKFTGALSKDGRLVVRLVFKLEKLRLKLKTRGQTISDRPNANRKAMVALLYKRGWDSDRIANAFEEIGNSL